MNAVVNDKTKDQPASDARALPPRFPVLPVGISAITMSDAVEVISGWIARRERHYVNVCTSDTTVKSYDDPELARVINEAGMATPDGMPLVWLGKARRHRVSRVYGPDLMLKVCDHGQDLGFRHFFYGATGQVLKDMETRLLARFPKLNIVGAHAPPYRPLTEEEEKADIEMIDRSGADIVWVGLGTPKQDYWVGRFRTKLRAPVLIAIGAAFDFHAGRMHQAPRWMMHCGLEWLFRLGTEPRRLWRRYVIGNPRFIYLILKQVFTGRPTTPWSGTSAKKAAAKDKDVTAVGDAPPASLPRVNVLGVGVNAVNMDQAVAVLLDAARKREKGYVCVTGVHGVMESRRDPELRRIHNRSLLTVPDGMPTVWTGHGQGYTRMGRVYGPDLMLRVCEESGERFSHFFYGATPDVLDKLVANLTRRCPDLRIAGTYAPPFRPLNDTEYAALQTRLAETPPDFFWVGLSTPKQERFMAEHSGKLESTVMLGTGAAFDIHAGLKKDAPAWVKKIGLQWFHRLLQEPGRLWKRYLTIVPSFLWLMGLQVLGIRKYSVEESDE